MNVQQVLAQFEATGKETAFHNRHIKPQIYAGLNGDNWRLKDYEARGGYQALRKVLGLDGGAGLTQDQVIATVKEAGIGDIKLFNLTAKFSKTPAAIDAPPPRLSAHTEEILKGLGYSAEKIKAFREKGAI
jgi:crotonobetainyl-CoA:carnitine CoA-transferase CaiB-like acyl-CoA transferase